MAGLCSLFFPLLFPLLVGCGSCTHPRRAPHKAGASQQNTTLAILAPPKALSATRPGRPATAGGAMGVNEGVGIPAAWVLQGRVRPNQEAALLQADTAALVDLGAKIVRANTATYPWLSWQAHRRHQERFDQADRWVSAVQGAGLEPLMVLGPWPGNQTAAHTNAYVPQDMDAYTAWIGRVVERYDHDGVDDMPGLLSPVRYWEVDNEPDLHNSVPPRGGRSSTDPADFETPEQYAKVLVATSAAIRKADPKALVLNAGLYRPHTDSGRAWLKALLEQPGVTDAFDILSLHCYSDRDDLGAQTRTIQTWQALAPDKPLWVTETSVASQGRAPYITPQWQARMLVGTYGLMLAGGADRIFWHTLADPPTTMRRGSRLLFSTHSLLQSLADGGFQDKPAGAAYRRLARLLADIDPSTLVELPATGGRLLKVGDGWLAFWGQPEVPPGAAVETDLITGTQHPAGSTAHAPAWLSPAG